MSNDEIRQFLRGVAVFASLWPGDALKFRPSDTIDDAFRGIYGPGTLPDEFDLLEFQDWIRETYALDLEHLPPGPISLADLFDLTLIRKSLD